MGKPLDETWWVKLNTACRWEIRRTVANETDDAPNWIAEFEDIDFRTDAERQYNEDQRARASLAAAAPEMARLLLECMWGAGGYAAAECVACGGSQEHHEESCSLVAVLTKAGVLP